jgi:hypothetical protein
LHIFILSHTQQTPTLYLIISKPPITSLTCRKFRYRNNNQTHTYQLPNLLSTQERIIKKTRFVFISLFFLLIDKKSTIELYFYLSLYYISLTPYCHMSHENSHTHKIPSLLSTITITITIHHITYYIIVTICFFPHVYLYTSPPYFLLRKKNTPVVLRFGFYKPNTHTRIKTKSIHIIITQSPSQICSNTQSLHISTCFYILHTLFYYHKARTTKNVTIHTFTTYIFYALQSSNKAQHLSHLLIHIHKQNHTSPHTLGKLTQLYYQKNQMNV